MMRNFSQLASEAGAKFPVLLGLWTRYSLDDGFYPEPEPNAPWTRWFAYHFDRGVAVGPWLSLVRVVQQWVNSQPPLQRLVHFVPFVEVGTDFIVQSNPPYDGGYSTSRYGEFLEFGTCAPAPWFFQQIATLHQECAFALSAFGRSGRDELLRRVIHATLIRPASLVFWVDGEGWYVYSPTITAEDVAEWASIAAV